MNELEAAARLHREGRLEEALASYAALRARDPASAEAAFRVALVQAQRGDIAAAVAALGEALALRDEPRFRLLEADFLERQGDPARAIAALRRALALDARFAPAHARLGILLHDAGDPDAAIEHFAAAAAQHPDDARAAGNLAAASERRGAALLAEGRVTRARDLLQTAIRAQPARATAWLRLAAAQLHLGETGAALDAYDRALDLDPPDAREIGSAKLVAMHYDDSRSPSAVLEAHRAWARKHAPSAAPVAFANARDPDRRLRIGYLSPRFHEASLKGLLAPVLARHDRSQVAIHCYANQDLDDEATRRYRSHADAWTDTRALDDAALAKRMREDGIDIAVDLAGHTPGSRVAALAHRPAPVAMTWLDYFDTTGIDATDVLVTDERHSPRDDAQSFAEELERLPRLRYAWEPPAFSPDPRPPRRSGAIVLGSFNRMAKVSPTTLAMWAAAMQELPDARLVLKNSALGHEEDRAAFASRFAAHGIDPARVEWRAYSSHATMLAEYGDIDIVLDTFPYTGGITTLEALWMGRPVVTRRGPTLIARQGAAILGALGLDELVAGDAAGYARVVAGLARDGDRLAALCTGLRDRMRRSEILDTGGMARALEATYRKHWKRWLDRASTP